MGEADVTSTHGSLLPVIWVKYPALGRFFALFISLPTSSPSWGQDTKHIHLLERQHHPLLAPPHHHHHCGVVLHLTTHDAVRSRPAYGVQVGPAGQTALDVGAVIHAELSDEANGLNEAGPRRRLHDLGAGISLKPLDGGERFAGSADEADDVSQLQRLGIDSAKKFRVEELTWAADDE